MAGVGKFGLDDLLFRHMVHLGSFLEIQSALVEVHDKRSHRHLFGVVVELSLGGLVELVAQKTRVGIDFRTHLGLGELKLTPGHQ